VYPPFRDLAERTLTDEQRLRVSARVSRPTLEMNLRELRKHLGVTQVELAKLADIARPELSRAERRADHMLSTLRRIVRALGGELELHAKFKDGEDVRLAVGD
jgi:transcriptional regulator with XRE-family HTH domain